MNNYIRHGYKLISVITVVSFVASPFSALAAESSSLSNTAQSSSESIPTITEQPVPAQASSQSSSVIKPNPFSLGEPEPTPTSEDSGESPPPSLLDSEDPAIPGGLNGQFAENSNKLPETDLSTGALTYKYSIQVPLGRNGMQPDISLVYNNQEASSIGNIFGYGWSVNIPYIERINRTGSDALYPTGYASASFRSSLSGELARISSGSYGPKVDDENFFRYTLASGSWTLTDKSGVTYNFGQTASAQQDSSTHAKVYKWLLNKVTDPNGNFITYDYFKNAGQIYPATISWTGFGADKGIFKLSFQRETRTDADTYYTPGFSVKNNYRINRIETQVSGRWARRYALSYGTGDNGRRSLLTGITESGQPESGDTITLPPVQFSYTVPVRGWQSSGDAALDNDPVGEQFGDVNGDGLPDIVRSQNCLGCGAHQASYVYLVHGTEAFTSASPSFVPPTIFYDPYGSSKDVGARLDDINADGKVDIYKYLDTMPGDDFGVYTNDGSGWTSSNSWNPPAVPIVCDPVVGNGCGAVKIAHVFDINGDGLPDVEQSTSGSATARLNTGSGWKTTSNFDPPVPFTAGVYIMDVNGDGLNDLVQSCDSGHCGAVYLNTGDSWVKDTTWATASFGFGSYTTDSGARVADINGDGLPDLIQNNCSGTSAVVINTGTGWVSSSSWDVPPAFVTCTGGDAKARIMDFTGDGMPDITTLNSGAYKNKGQRADLLKHITFSQGGTASVSYQSSHRYRDSSNNLLNHKLPYILSTVKQVTLDPSGGGTMASSAYSYENGDYYFNTSLDRRISGFGKVTRTDSSSKTVTYFHQGNGASSSWSEPADSKARIGKPFRIDITDRSGNLYKRTWDTWSDVSLGQDRSLVVLASTQDQIYDGNATHKDVATSYSYSGNNGNLTQKVEFGQVVGSSTDNTLSDTGSDKFTIAYTYASNSQNFYLPRQVTKTDQSSNKVNETKNYYDGQSLGLLTNGNLTKQERWASASYYINTQRTYDSHGLVTQIQDPRGKITSSSYDSFALYPVRVEDALDYLTSRSFDYSSGKVTRLLDPNGSLFENVYDGLDRLIEEKQPDIAEGIGGGMFSLSSMDSGLTDFFTSEPTASLSIADMLASKSGPERATIKGQAIAQIGFIPRTQMGDYEIEVADIQAMAGGVQVFARVWDKEGQIGFGPNGTVDLERFRIFNPPIMVPDGTKKTVYHPNLGPKGMDIQENNYKEDPKEALLQVLEGAIASVAKNKPRGVIIDGKRGSTIDTFYPDANPETTSFDGRLGCCTTQTTWNTIWRTTTTAAYEVNDSGTTGDMQYATQTPGWFRAYRNYFLFDTSAIPDTATIASATLSLYGVDKLDQDSDSPTYGITASDPASNTSITANDWDNISNTRFASDVTYSGFTTSGYNNFSLNSSGLAAISKTGISKFAGRFGSDIDNSAPTLNSSNQTMILSVYMADRTGTTNDPKLVVEHTTPASPSSETKNIYTYTDTSGAVNVSKLAYLDDSTIANTYTYFDGLNRKVQERQETEASQSYSVRDFVYNDRNLLSKESISYLSSDSLQTTPTATSNLYTNYTYDLMGRPSTVTDSIGSTSYAYDDFKRTVRDPKGHNKYFFQDAYGNLARVDEINNSASRSTNYTYNGNNDLTKITDASGNIRNFTYDGLDRRTHAQDLHHPADATFGTWTYVYDDVGNLASSSDPKGQLFNYSYDNLNRPLTENYTGHTGTEVTYTYDNCLNGIGHLCSVISPGTSISYQYNGIGLKSNERSKLGSTTYQTHHTYDRQSNPITITNPDDSEIKYRYNDAGMLESIARKESGDDDYTDVVTNIDYGPHQKRRVIDFANCVRTTNTYDSVKMYRLQNIFTENVGCGEMMMSQAMGGSMADLFSADVSTTPVTDSLKDLSAAERADAKGRAIAQIGTIPMTHQGDYDIEVLSMEPIKGGVQVFARAWDKEGQIGFGTDGSVDVERFRILNPPILVDDPKGDIIREWKDDFAGELRQRHLREDPQEALLQVLAHTIEVKKQKFGSDRIVQGKVGNTTSTFYPDANTESTSVDGFIVSDPAPRVTWSTIHNGLENDARTISVDSGASSANASILRKLENDSDPWNNIGRSVWLFDTSSLPDSDTISAATLSLYEGTKASAGAGFTPAWSWGIVSSNPASNTGLVKQDYADESFGTTDFATRKTFTNITNAAYNDFALNASGIANITNTGVSKFGGRVGSDIDNSEPSGTGDVYNYAEWYFADQTGTTNDPKLVVEHSTVASSTTLQNISYTYDADSNITRIIDDAHTAAEKVATLSYDDLDRLTRAVVGSVSFGAPYTHTFAYDPIGNITSKSDEGLYRYASLSLGGDYANPHAVYTISKTASFSYDNNGNLTNIASNSSNIATISWDYRNQIEKYKSSAASVSYAYDVSGQRVRVKNGTSTTYYPTKFYNTDGTHILKDIFTPDGMLVATIKGSGASISLHYVHPDHLGSTNVVSNESGSLESLNDYHEYGETRVSQGGPQSQRKYIGEQADTDTTLNYLNARYQSGKWGRFISEDPSFLAMGDANQTEQLTGQKMMDVLADPQQLNSYAYGRNNSLSNIDKTGSFSISALFNPLNTLTGGPLGTLGLWRIIAAAGGVNNPLSSARPISSALLNHSLGFNHGALSINEGNQGQYGNVVDAIRDSSKFQGYVAGRVAAMERNGSFTDQGSLVFDDGGDLFSALNKVNINLQGTKAKDGTWSLNVGVSDKYNYEANSNYGKTPNSLLFTGLNNAGVVGQAGGVISQYPVNINFGYTVKPAKK